MSPMKWIVFSGVAVVATLASMITPAAADDARLTIKPAVLTTDGGSNTMIQPVRWGVGVGGIGIGGGRGGVGISVGPSYGGYYGGGYRGGYYGGGYGGYYGRGGYYGGYYPRYYGGYGYGYPRYYGGYYAQPSYGYYYW